MLILNSCRISICRVILDSILMEIRRTFYLKKNWIIKLSNVIEMKSWKVVLYILGFVFSYCAEMVNLKSFCSYLIFRNKLGEDKDLYLYFSFIDFEIKISFERAHSLALFVAEIVLHFGKIARSVENWIEK